MGDERDLGVGCTDGDDDGGDDVDERGGVTWLFGVQGRDGGALGAGRCAWAKN